MLTAGDGHVALHQFRHERPFSPQPLPAALLPLTGERWLALSVADTGPGIASEDLRYVFERFYRGDRSGSRSSGGTGLGLAIARQLVEAHGRKIAVVNEPQGGTPFTFVLPVE